MSALTGKASGRVALLIGAIATAIAMVVTILAVGASAADPQLVRNVNGDACRELGYGVDAYEVPVPRGTESDPPEYEETFQVDDEITLSVFSPSNRSRVDFTVIGGIVDGAILFNRPDQKLGNEYDYRPEGGVTEGTLLPPPRDQGNDKLAVFCFRVKADPTISTTATANAVVGEVISDTATLSNGNAPTGTVTFTLYSDSACSVQVAQLTGSVQADGTASSGDYTTTAAGTYYWIASYEGDDYNNPASGACGDAGETSTVAKATPSLTSSATASVTVGGTISSSANLTGGYLPTGTISFSLYTDAACTVQPETVPPDATVSGNGLYGSGAYATTAAGTIYWKAVYSGDANNESASGTCDASVVGKATPSLTTLATQTAALGDDISDTATLGGGYNATGSISFELYRDAACSSLVTALPASTPVTGAGDYSSNAYSVPTVLDAAGDYYWIASYSGDANNEAVSGTCGDDGETTTVYEFNAKCGIPITRTDGENGTAATFIRPEGSDGCNAPGVPADDTDKYGSLSFFVTDGTPGVELALSGDGEPNAKFVGEVTFDTSGLTSIPIIRIDDDEDANDDFRPMAWNVDIPGPTLFFDGSGNLIDADFTCPIGEIWCILEATIMRDNTTWRIGGLGVDPKWSI